MTNFELYKGELSKIVAAGKAIAIVNGKPTNCSDYIVCENCDRHNRCGDVGLVKWLLSETENCKICKNLKVDDKILVSNSGDYWAKRYFAGYDSENDVVITFDSGTTSWSVDDETRIAHWKYAKLPEEEVNGQT